MHSIIEQLKASLEKLDVSKTNVDFAALFQLKSVPALKTLICFDDDIDDIDAGDIENLKQQSPHISINEEEDLYIACPFNYSSIY